MIKNVDPKVLINGKWTFVKVSGKNKNVIRVKDLYYDISENYANNSAIIYYKSLVDDGIDKTIALIKALLATKNVVGVSFDGDKETIKFEKDPFFLNKQPALKISYTTPELIESKDEILMLSLKNLTNSREQFLDETIHAGTGLYEFDFGGYSSSFKADHMKNKIVFNLQNISYDERFVIDTLKDFINECRDTVLMIKEDDAVTDVDSVNFSLVLNQVELRVKCTSLRFYNLVYKWVTDHNNEIANKSACYGRSKRKNKK